MSEVRRQAGIATLAVSGSRITGLIREMVFAFFFGASAAYDAFIAAFRIPNLLRDLFAEGALSNAFVTVFSKKHSREGDSSAWELANNVLTFLVILMGFVTLFGLIFSPWIVKIAASGFEGEKLGLTILLNRILFPFILFVSLAAVVMGMLNSRGHFALPQSASTFFNITSIVVGLASAFWMAPDAMTRTFNSLVGGGPRITPGWEEGARAITGMAIGTLFGGMVQWFVQMPSVVKLGFRPRFGTRWRRSGLFEVLRLTGPAIMGGAAVQVNVLINTNFASYLVDGSISWLNYAFRLMQFPIGVFGVAIALATTPAISRLTAQGDEESFRRTLRESTQLVLFLCLPSALGLIVLAEPILALIYQYGHFTAFDTIQSGRALMAYSVGLCFYALIKVYQPAFLAFEDARTPMVISLSSILVNLVLNWFLVFVFHFAHWGLALGTSCVAVFNCILLTVMFRKKLSGIWSSTLSVQIGRMFLASLVSVFAGWYVSSRLPLALSEGGLGHRLIVVLVPIGLAVVVYLSLSHLLGVSEARLIWLGLKKRLLRSSP